MLGHLAIHLEEIKNGFYLISFIRINCKWVTFKYPKLEVLENLSTLRN